jgi:hypothetical protein
VIRDETSELSFTLVSSPQDAFVAEARHHLHAFLAREDVDDELVTYFVGQVVGSMNSVKPTRRVVLEMVEEFIDTLERLDGLVNAE